MEEYFRKKRKIQCDKTNTYDVRNLHFSSIALCHVWEIMVANLVWAYRYNDEQYFKIKNQGSAWMKAKRLIRKPYFFDHAPYLQNMRYKTKNKNCWYIQITAVISRINSKLFHLCICFLKIRFSLNIMFMRNLQPCWQILWYKFRCLCIVSTFLLDRYIYVYSVK